MAALSGGVFSSLVAPGDNVVRNVCTQSPRRPLLEGLLGMRSSGSHQGHKLAVLVQGIAHESLPITASRRSTTSRSTGCWRSTEWPKSEKRSWS